MDKDKAVREHKINDPPPQNMWYYEIIQRRKPKGCFLPLRDCVQGSSLEGRLCHSKDVFSTRHRRAADNGREGEGNPKRDAKFMRAVFRPK